LRLGAAWPVIGASTAHSQAISRARRCRLALVWGADPGLGARCPTGLDSGLRARPRSTTPGLWGALRPGDGRRLPSPLRGAAGLGAGPRQWHCENRRYPQSPAIRFPARCVGRCATRCSETDRRRR
nr:hypothetical protein [Tanacetum cinerariifolium]